LALALVKADGVGVTDAADELEGLIEVLSDFGGSVGVGVDDDLDASGEGEFEEFLGGIDFADVFAEASGADLHDGIGVDEGLDDGFVVGAEVALGAEAEFFGEVGMGAEVEVAAADAFFVEMPVERPDFFDGSGFFPPGEVFGVIDIPAGGDVMDTADEVVPGGHGAGGFEPGLAAFEVVALEGEADGEGGEGGLGGCDEFEVSWELFEVHAPVVEGLGHGVVVGEADFGESGGESGVRVVGGEAFGVAAEGGMGVVVSEHGEKKKKNLAGRRWSRLISQR
jgi:hypothetical protein